MIKKITSQKFEIDRTALVRLSTLLEKSIREDKRQVRLCLEDLEQRKGQGDEDKIENAKLNLERANQFLAENENLCKLANKELNVE